MAMYYAPRRDAGSDVEYAGDSGRGPFTRITDAVKSAVGAPLKGADYVVDSELQAAQALMGWRKSLGSMLHLFILAIGILAALDLGGIPAGLTRRVSLWRIFNWLIVGMAVFGGGIVWNHTTESLRKKEQSPDRNGRRMAVDREYEHAFIRYIAIILVQMAAIITYFETFIKRIGDDGQSLLQQRGLHSPITPPAGVDADLYRFLQSQWSIFLVLYLILNATTLNSFMHFWQDRLLKVRYTMQ